MAKQPVTRRCCSFGAVLAVAALVPRAHVQPAWWRGGWRRPHGSEDEVELLSLLGAMLMPKVHVGELFRSFPSPNGEEDLEPTLTAYGILKDSNAALFVQYDGTHGKREGLNDESRKALLAYGPPGSHILHISHTKSRRLKDMVLSIKVGDWQPGDEASLSLVLDDIRRQVSHGLKQVMCPEILEQLNRLKSQKGCLHTSEKHDFCVALRGATVNQKSLECRLFARGFSPASINRMLKSAHLSGRCVEAKLESRTLFLLSLNESQSQIRDAIAKSSPALGGALQKNLKQKVQWRSNLDDQQQVGKAIATTPSILCSNALQNLEETSLWLLDLGLSHRQAAKVVKRCPAIVDSGKPHMEWFFRLGMTKNQIRKAVCAFPLILSCSIQEDLMPKLDWFLGLGLTKKQVAKLTATLPHSLAYSIDKNLKRKVDWLLQLGMRQGQVAKLIAVFPSVLGYSVEQSLKPKVEWFLQLGLTQGQIAKVVAASPQVLGYSIEKKIRPKVEWFSQLGMTHNQVAKLIAVFPAVLGYSVENNLKPKVEWLLQLGMKQHQVVKLFAVFPSLLGFSVEQNLKLKIQWLLQLGMTQEQVAKVVAAFPQVLGCSVKQNLKPKVEWLLQLGMTQGQIAKLIAASPQVLGYSVEQNLKPKVEWFLQLGMMQGQVAKVIAAFPQILSLSIEKNLVPKQALLQDVLGAEGALEVLLRQPQTMGMSYLRLSTRLMILVKRNETEKLVTAMRMTRESFKSRFLDDL